MMKRKKAVFNWSGGKDSALALYKIMQDETYDVVSLLTTVNRHSGRSTMHGIPTSLLMKQAESIGLPLYIVDLTPKGDMIDYETAMNTAVSYFLKQGVHHFVFGDIFLHDVRSYREKQLSPYGITVVEPLWNKTSEQIMDEFLKSGLQTVIVTITEGSVSEALIGCVIDRELIESFPPQIDVCGENGEYHTFCYAGGMFRVPIPFSLGEPLRESFLIRHDDGSIKEYTYWFANLNE